MCPVGLRGNSVVIRLSHWRDPQRDLGIVGDLCLVPLLRNYVQPLGAPRWEDGLFPDRSMASGMLAAGVFLRHDHSIIHPYERRLHVVPQHQREAVLALVPRDGK